MASNYFQEDGYISQSSLKRKVGMFYTSTDPTGSLVDCLLTESKETFDATYKVSRVIITSSIKQLYDEIYKLGELNDKNILKANEVVNYGKGSYDLKRIKKDLKKFNLYWEEKQTGKEIVTIEDYDRARAMADVVRKHPSTQFLKDCQKQREIYNENFYGHRVKGKTDYERIINDKRQVIDLKTIHHYNYIRTSFWKFRIDFQLAWYTDIAPEQLETVNPLVVFIAPGADYPVVVKVSTHSLNIGRYGGQRMVDYFIENSSSHAKRLFEYLYGYIDLLEYHPNQKPLIYPTSLPREI